MARTTLKNVLGIMTLTCDQAAQLISRAQESPLKGTERWALSFHLLICRLCRKYKRQLKLMHSFLTRMADPRTHDTMEPLLLDPEQRRSFQSRLSEKIRENLDSM